MKPDIKSRHKELNLTLEQVGDLVGVGKSTVRKWETGDIENMKRDKIVKLAKALEYLHHISWVLKMRNLNLKPYQLKRYRLYQRYLRNAHIYRREFNRLHILCY